MRYIIHVTQDDINEGEPASCNGCPLSLAIGKVLPESEIYVLGPLAVVDREFVALPSDCTEFVSRFDEGGKVSPFSFILDLSQYKEGYTYK